MLVVFVRCHVKPGCEAAFVAASTANAEASNREPGVMRFDLLQETDPRRFVLVEAYRDEAAPAAHRATGHYAAWKEAVEPLLAEERTKETFQGIYLPERSLKA